MDPRMQREAVNIATNLLEAFARQDRRRVEDGLGKLAIADGSGNFIGLSQVLSDYLASQGPLDPSAMSSLAGRLIAELGESPLASLLTSLEKTDP